MEEVGGRSSSTFFKALEKWVFLLHDHCTLGVSETNNHAISHKINMCQKKKWASFHFTSDNNDVK